MGIEYIITLCIGILFGVIFKSAMENKEKVTGVVQIDHNSGLCRFKITNEELSNPKCKKVQFIVDHNATITEDDYFGNSQEKQGL